MNENNQNNDGHWWTYSVDELEKKLDTHVQNGLSSTEAGNRFKEYGPNQFTLEPPPSALKIFFNQFNSFIIWVLLAAAVLSIFLGEKIDAVVIIAILFINAILGFIQEYRAEKSLAALKKMAKPHAKVIRDGEAKTLLSTEITIGDIVLLDSGDLIPADGRIIHAVQLTVQEASLTGESIPVYKTSEKISEEDIPLGDRKNMGYKGTIIGGGKGKLLVTGIGRKTEIGKIAQMIQHEKEVQTPLQRRLEHLGRRLVFFCIGVVVFVFLLGIFGGQSWREMLMVSLSLAVAAVPEGLPTVVTITLAIGVQRMAKRQALIRKLPAVETLGCTTVICTDKTGTLTQNEMMVTNLWVDEKDFKVTGSGYRPEGVFILNDNKIDPQEYPDLVQMLRIAVLCNSAELIQKDNQWIIQGDPTEGALLSLGRKANLIKKDLEKKYEIVDELPFNSDRKRMSILGKMPEEKANILFMKGAPDIIIDLSKSILKNGSESDLTEEIKKTIYEVNHHYTSQGLRVLGFAYKRTDEMELKDSSENDLVFIGLIAMKDPLRPEAKDAIRQCKKAGILTSMVTGDFKDTALAIAKELDLMQKDSLAIDGQELAKISDEEFEEKVSKISVYARVSPEHKMRIVKAWKKKGEVIAMTGDGVNDAPAIKAADIGISMGEKGTEVAKEAADMVILDDNFASIVNAVEEGRGIYENIIKFVVYLFSTNVGEIFVILFGMLISFWIDAWGQFVPLLPVQILWINLVTDGFPAISLAMDPIDPKSMEKAPRNPKSPIIDSRLAVLILFISIIVAAGTLTACFIGLQENVQKAQTMAFTTLVVIELVKVQVIRSIYNIGWLSNYWLIAAIAISFIAQLCVLYLPPLQYLFKTTPLGTEDWLIIFAITFIVWILASSFINFFNYKQKRG